MCKYRPGPDQELRLEIPPRAAKPQPSGWSARGSPGPLFPALRDAQNAAPLTRVEIGTCLSLSRFLVCLGLMEKGLFKQRLEGGEERNYWDAPRTSDPGRRSKNKGPEQKRVWCFQGQQGSAWLGQDKGRQSNGGTEARRAGPGRLRRQQGLHSASLRGEATEKL